MPTSLAGFLLFAGLILFVVSYVKGTLKLKDFELPSIDDKGKEAIRYLGFLMMLISACLFVARFFVGEGDISGMNAAPYNKKTTEIKPSSTPENE